MWPQRVAVLAIGETQRCQGTVSCVIGGNWGYPFEMVFPKESSKAYAGNLYYLLLSGRENYDRSLRCLCSRNRNHYCPFLKNSPVLGCCLQSIAFHHHDLALCYLFPTLLFQIQLPQGMSALPLFRRWRLHMLENWKKKPIRFQKRQISNKRTNQRQKVMCHPGLRFSCQKGPLLAIGYEKGAM